MKARRLIDGAAYGPEALKAIGQAFDEAWASISHHFGSEPKSIEAARLNLAEALLSVASEDSRDVEGTQARRTRSHGALRHESARARLSGAATELEDGPVVGPTVPTGRAHC
jgi:hypothetical protein